MQTTSPCSSCQLLCSSAPDRVTALDDDYSDSDTKPLATKKEELEDPHDEEKDGPASGTTKGTPRRLSNFVFVFKTNCSPRGK